jgi:hypothetical protein
MEFLEQTFLNNSLRVWSLALLTAFAITVLLLLLKRIFLARILPFTSKTKTKYDDLFARVLTHTNLFLLAVLAVYIGSLMLELSEPIKLWLNRVALITILIQVTVWGNALITYSIQQYQEDHLDDGAARVTTLRAASFVIKLVLYYSRLHCFWLWITWESKSPH